MYIQFGDSRFHYANSNYVFHKCPDIVIVFPVLVSSGATPYTIYESPNNNCWIYSESLYWQSNTIKYIRHCIDSIAGSDTTF